jgi:hypothetical protein
VSNVQIENGGEVGIELTDGWYRIRATTDKALTRAAKKGKLAAGRKIAVAGARVGFLLIFLTRVHRSFSSKVGTKEKRF